MTVMVVAHPIPGFSGYVRVEDVGLPFIGGFTGPTDVPSYVQDQLTDEGYTLNAVPLTDYGPQYVTNDDLEDEDSAASVALRAAFVPVRHHRTPSPFPVLNKNGSGRVECGVHEASGKRWSFNSTGLYQVDSPTATNWAAVTLPANVTTSGQEAAVAVWTPPNGVLTLFLLANNTSSSRIELWSSPVVARTVAPTWTLVQQFSANARLIPWALESTSRGVYAGEYSSSPDIAGGPSLWRTTDGVTATRVLGPLGDGTRHIHAVFEDTFAPGTIYVTVGDTTAPHFLYRSTDGVTFNVVTSFDAIGGANPNPWQAVAGAVTQDSLWLASDQPYGGGPILVDRATLTPRWASTKGRHDAIAVPGGIGGRVVTDFATTASNAVATSATAAFTAADRGRGVEAANLPTGTYITTVTNATTVTLSQNALSTVTQTAYLLSDTFFGAAYAGAIDPVTGWFYYAANDASIKGTAGGVFVMTGPGEQPSLVFPLYNRNPGNHRLYIAGDYLFYDVYGAVPLLRP